MSAGNSPIRDRESALAFLFGRIDYERTRTIPYRARRFKLDRMQRLVALLGHPERAYPAIHIAGTKGKGSTAAMLAAVWTAAGFRTGLYTSPHLQRVEERFVVDGQECSEAELVALLSDIHGVLGRLDAEAANDADLAEPTYFEITTAAALLHFQRHHVDCAVLEVGLGGRLDSTNVCHPAVSVITTISLDHTRQLGRTPAEIAAEKAGIIKPGIPVITGVRELESLEVIESIARQNDAALLAAGRDFDFAYLGTTGRDAAPGEPNGGDVLDYREQIGGVSRRLEHVRIGMMGRHQAANAAVALATLGQLQRQGWTIDESAIRSGLARARCPARFELVGRRPTVILDAAHNPASVLALKETLDDHFPATPRLLVFATSIDKDARQMLQHLLPGFEHVVFTRYLNNPRARDPVELETLATELADRYDWPQPRTDVAPSPRAAWQRIRSLATPSHLICVTGSFFLAAEIREHLSLLP